MYKVLLPNLITLVTSQQTSNLTLLPYSMISDKVIRSKEQGKCLFTKVYPVGFITLDINILSPEYPTGSIRFLNSNIYINSEGTKVPA